MFIDSFVGLGCRLVYSVICIVDDYRIPCSVSSGCNDASASQRAVYRWWVAHAPLLFCFLVLMSCNLSGVGR